MEDLYTQQAGSRPDRDRLARRDRGAAAPAHEVVAAARLRQLAPSTERSSTTRRAPGRPEVAGRPRQVPLHHQGGPARQLSVRHVRRAARASSCASTPRPGTTGKPTVVGYTAADIDIWADLMARSIRAAGGRPGDIAAHRLRLRPVHRRARRALRRRAARLHRGPDLRRHDRAAGAADPRLRAADHHGDAVLHALDPRRVPPPGPRPARDLAARSASSAPSRGPTRCARRSSRPSTCTPSTSTACPR